MGRRAWLVAYEEKDVESSEVWNPETEKFEPLGKIKIKTRKKYIPPSQSSIIFWLANRMPELWQSVNKMDRPSDSNKGAILEALQSMVDEPDN